MSFVCRGVDCKKSFSSKFNRNKHERIKGHFLQSSLEIPYDDSTGLFSCSTVGCQTTSKYKASIKKHLDICKQIKINKEVVAKNRICEICNKVFQRKSNRDRHYYYYNYSCLQFSGRWIASTNRSFVWPHG